MRHDNHLGNDDNVDGRDYDTGPRNENLIIHGARELNLIRIGPLGPWAQGLAPRLGLGARPRVCCLCWI